MYAYAKTGDMGALEEFMAGGHSANLQARVPSPACFCTPGRHTLTGQTFNVASPGALAPLLLICVCHAIRKERQPQKCACEDDCCVHIDHEDRLTPSQVSRAGGGRPRIRRGPV